MNYQQIYNNIIDNAKQLSSTKSRYRGDGNYYESHHILPRCMGGINAGTVLLTAKEHFICHELLCEIHPHNSKLQYAFWRMITGLINPEKNKKMGKNFRPSSNVYERMRKEVSRLRKESITPEQIERFRQLGLANKGCKLSEEHRRHISEDGKGRVQSDITKKKISEKNKGKLPWCAGKKLPRPSDEAIAKMLATRLSNGSYDYCSDETKLKRINTRIAKNNLKHTQETKDKISAANKGKGVGRKISADICLKKSISMQGKNKGTHKTIIIDEFGNQKIKMVR